MSTLLDQLEPIDANVHERMQRSATLELDKTHTQQFKWMLEYTVFRNNDNSWFEKRVIALFEPYGDVVIRDYTSRRDDEAFRQLYQKRHVLFHRPAHFRTDVRVICHLLVNAARVNLPFALKMFMASNQLGLTVKYASVAPIDLSQFRSMYNTYPYPTGDLVRIVNLFTDSTQEIKKDKEATTAVIAAELNRIRQHYLNIAVV